MLGCQLMSPSEIPSKVFTLESLEPPTGTEVWDKRLGLMFIYGEPPVTEGLAREALEFPIVTGAVSTEHMEISGAGSGVDEPLPEVLSAPGSVEPEARGQSSRRWMAGLVGGLATALILVVASLGWRIRHSPR